MYRYLILCLSAIVASLFSIVQCATAQSIALDSTFADNGIFLFSVAGQTTTNGTGIELQSDGKYVISGKAASQNPNESSFLAVRLNHNGSLDNSFGTNGYSSHNVYDRSFAHDLGLQQDGKILLAGQDFNDFTVTENIGVMRLNTDGSIDSTFNDDGRLAINYGWTEEAHTIIQQPDGKIILTGHTDYDLPTNTIESNKLNIFVARLLSNGYPDSSFGTNGFYTLDVNHASSDFSKNMLLLEDGKIICSGATSTNANQNALMVRLTPDGKLDSTFGINGIAQNIFGFQSMYWRMARQADGKIIVVGQTIFSSLNYDFLVQRFNADGSIDSTFGTNGSFTTQLGQKAEKFEDVAIQSDGKIVCAGYSANNESNKATGDAVVMRLNPNGTLDNTFDGDGIYVLNIVEGFDETKACLIDHDGNIVVTGFAHKISTAGGSIFAFRLKNGTCSSSYSISASGDINFCQGGKVTLTVSPGASSYQWINNGNNIGGATSVSYVAKNSGHYSCAVAANCGVVTTNTIIVKENSNPKAKITPSGTVSICEGDKTKLQANTGSSLDYQWYKDGAEISGATESFYKASVAGSYTVLTTSNKGCTKLSTPTMVEITCKSELNSDIVFSIYPNPNQGKLSIDGYFPPNKTLMCDVYNVVGEKVFTVNVVAENNTIPLDISFLKEGMYFLSINEHDKNRWEKFFIVK